MNYLDMIFIEGIKLNKISFESFIAFLEKNSWIGMDHEETTFTGENISYNWLSVIIPSVQEYFIQTENVLKKANLTPNYITCIDSLTLKIEGILREIAKLLSINTTIISKDGGNREMFTEDLLSQEKVQKLLGEDDILLLKFAFTSAGLNLRNNIAHCFFRNRDYSYHYMHLLIVVILRLGRFTLQ